ncbi:SDR family NAD(P)-dependent oxidoreductase [Hymenobacter sp. GOD-10R]|uniref:SDR family NAD(P)-dependent oxidoreductase n=1 Tax=Hymenobacter sp. GOD-10R TaxID=3093922 RepID=UPI002D783A32|nr:SDR family oxidoreductase [Hymenobacter sp. GOD-10R]WRQ31286.1 SDR family oxidoreductase [Hymenobacter sp. GOD-10R]
MKGLSNKAAFVTGGSRGIGAGIVRALAAEGVRVAFTYVRGVEPAQALVSELALAGAQVLALQADTAQPIEVQQAISTAVAHFGQLDILVNNAGVYVHSPVDEAAPDEEALAHLWQVNTYGTAQTVRAAVQHMAPGGRIITIGSGSNIRTPYAGTSDYAASKGALAAYTRGWARDLAPRHITANIIQPGLIDTDMTPTDPATVASLLQPIALGRFGTAQEVGEVVAFLASEAAGYITGATLNVDGGWSV